MDLAPEAAAKAVVYAAVLIAIGTSAARWLLAPRVLDGDDARRFERRLAWLARAAAAAMLAAQAFRAVAHTAAAFGWTDAFAGESLTVIVLESRWGGGWRLQVVAAVFLLAAAFLTSVHRSLGWALVAAGSAASAVTMPLLGHAASNPIGLVLHSAHVIGAGVWIGTLGSVLLVGGPVHRLLPHFSTMALAGAAVAVSAGAIAAVQYVGSPVNLWTTGYGRALVVKLAMFGGVVGCGYLNWRRWSAPQSESPGDHPLRLPVVEALLAGGIVLVSSVLTELAHP